MADDKAQAAPKPPGQSPVATILGLVLPAILAGAAAFGGARFAAAGGGAHGKPAAAVKEASPPGPTLGLEPFIFTVTDGTHKTHAVKVSLAVEFKAKTKEEELKNLVPRVRDACLAFLRTLTYEATTTQGLDDKSREDLLKRIREQGAGEAEKILVTDFVVQ